MADLIHTVLDPSANSVLMRTVARVSKMPEKLPWIEGEDYYVMLGTPEYGYPMRTRDDSGETFQICGHGLFEIASDDPTAEIDARLKQLAHLELARVDIPSLLPSRSRIATS